MNISGNQLDLWKQLVGVGNDPWPYSTLRTPTLVFEGVSSQASSSPSRSRGGVSVPGPVVRQGPTPPLRSHH